MKNFFFITLIVFTIILNFNISAQKMNKKDEKKLKNIEILMDEKKYLTAINLLKDLKEKYPDDLSIKYMLGICYIFHPYEKDKSVEILESLQKKLPNDNIIRYYLGRAYHVNYEFEKGIKILKKFIKKEDFDMELVDEAKRYINYCQNAIELYNNPVDVNIDNIGSPVNTKGEEYVPIISPDESMLVFTYRGERSTGGKQDEKGKPDPNGEYYEDVMVSYQVNNKWIMPQSIGNNINTKGHDASVSLSVDGQKLFIYKNEKNNGGDLYISNLEGEDWSRPSPLKGEVNTKYWEGSASLAGNGLVLYFASDRPGGFGGRDIYTAELQEDGSWGKIKNLGQVINTPFDEDAPFIHPDNRSLYFSSKGHNSMGGYDIFFTYLEDNGKWRTPENIGYPINTPEDDRYLVISADGSHGYFSSSRIGGMGLHDIYIIKPGAFEKMPLLAFVLGIIDNDGDPVAAKINLINPENGKIEAQFKSNEITGKYMMTISQGKTYKLKIEVEGYKPYEEVIDAKDLQSFVNVKHNFKLSSNGEILKLSEDGKTLQNDFNVEKVKQLSAKLNQLYSSNEYKNILSNYGKVKIPNAKYFIQIDNEKKGPFSTLLETEKIRKEILNKNPEKGKIAQIYFTTGDKTLPLEETFPDLKNKYAMIGKESKEIFNIIEKAKATQKEILAEKENENINMSDEKIQYNKEIVKKYGYIKNKNIKFFVELPNNNRLGPYETLAEAIAIKETIKSKNNELGKMAEIYISNGNNYRIEEVFPELKENNSVVSKPVQDIYNTFINSSPVTEQKEELPPLPANIEDKIVATIQAYTKNNPCEGSNSKSDFSWFVGKDLNDKDVYNKLINQAGRICKDNLIFKVQIGAYRHPENFKYPYLKKFGNAEIRDYPDGITRFTMGNFTTLKDAEIYRQKIIKAGQKDAWITPFYKNKRMLMQELIAVNFYNLSVN